MRDKIIILSFIWIIIHLFDVMKLILVPLPWSLDEALGAIVFLFIGDYAKNIEHKQFHFLILIIPFIFITVNHTMELNYKFNMKSMMYNHYLLDLIVPVSFTYMLYRLSFLLSHVDFIKSVLVYLGKSSMTIYFTHGAILYLLGKYFSLNIWIIIAVTVIIGGILHNILYKFKLLRILFTGDFR